MKRRFILVIWIIILILIPSTFYLKKFSNSNTITGNIVKISTNHYIVPIYFILLLFIWSWATVRLLRSNYWEINQ